MHQAKKFGTEILVHTLFQSIWPIITYSMPPGVCSHRNFFVRASCAQWEFLKWATLRQYKSASHELFIKSFVTTLIMTGSTWLQFFVRSYSIRKSLVYSKYATTINSGDENTRTQATEKSPSCCILGCYVISALQIKLAIFVRERNGCLSA